MRAQQLDKPRIYRLARGAWILQLTPTSKWIYPTHRAAVEAAEATIYLNRRHYSRMARAR